MEQRPLKEKSLEVNRHNPFVQLIGVEIVEVAPDRSLLRLELRPETMNPHGLVHGGALFTPPTDGLTSRRRARSTSCTPRPPAPFWPRLW